MVPILKNAGERSTAKKYCPVSLLSVVSKVFEKVFDLFYEVFFSRGCFVPL